MKQAYPPDAPKFGWKRQQTRHGLEYFHYPSDLARQLWLHPFAIGRSKTKPGETNHHLVEDRYLLHFVFRGELWHRVRNQVHVARQGDACLMDVSELLSHGAGGSVPAISYWVSFNGKDMPRYFSELRADRAPVFAGINVPVMIKLFRELMQRTAHEDAAYEPRAAGLLGLLLAELYAVRVKERALISLGADARPYSAPVRKGIDWIVRYYSLPYSLKQLCAKVGYSRSHYSRLFHKETGMPPAAWANRYRVEQAKRLMMTSGKSVAEVAAAVGIHDASYFTRLFRSLAGQTPRMFRRDQHPRPMSRAGSQRTGIMPGG